ncbi:uncharacterized protein METZ01_LOCUS223335, partial [marine metagenome]
MLYTVNPLHPHFIVDSKKGDFLILVLNDISGLETISGVYLNLLKLSIMNNGKNKLA